jgi:hypothetical protein
MTAPVKTAISISRQDSNSGFFLLMMQPELLRDGRRISLRPQARCARFSQTRAGGGDSERTSCR